MEGAEESSPLLQAPTNTVPGEDEPPPPYTPSTAPLVSCRVCNFTICLEGKENVAVVQCPECNEATPIKAPPPGRRFIRCECNLLLVCNSNASQLSCPRCRRTLTLMPSDTEIQLRLRYTCGNCQRIFSVRIPGKFSRCPHCRKVTSLGTNFAKRRGILCILFGLLFLGAATALTVITYEMAREHGGIYVAWIGGFITGLLFILRGGIYCSIKTSLPISPIN